MASPNDSSPFETVQFSKLRGLAERFEQAWSAQQDSSKGIDLTPFLPESGDPARSPALVELIKTDLACRWQRGLPTSLEMYVEKFPEIGPLEKLSPSLIYEEYRIRTRHGSPAPLNQYKSRFPDQFAAFESLIQTEQSQMGGPTSAVDFNVNTPADMKTISPLAMVGNGTLVGGHYTLNKRIGSGGFGEVWLGNDIHGNIPKAIKIISRSVESDEAKQELHALEIIKRLNHPYLLRTEGFFAEQQRLIVVMELAEGSLREMLKKTKKETNEGLPVEKLLVYMRHAADALDYLHEEGIFHRDIKPENILLVGKIAKVADFGLAKIAANRQSTKTNFAGTSAYSSPETWKGRVTSKSDLYSLAVTYAELRLGRPVFKGNTIYEFMIEHLQSQPDLDPMPDAEKEVLYRALAKEPSDRYENCSEFVRELERAVAGPGSLPSTGAGPRHNISGSPTPVSKWSTPVAAGRPGSSGSFNYTTQRAGSNSSSPPKPPSWKTPSYPEMEVPEQEPAQPYRRSRRRGGPSPVLIGLGFVIVVGLALCGMSIVSRGSLQSKVNDDVAERNFSAAVKSIDNASFLVSPFKTGMRDDVLAKGLEMAEKAKKSDNTDDLIKTTVALFDAFPKDERGPSLLNEGLQKQVPDWLRREQFAKAYKTLMSLPLDVPAKRDLLPEITKKWLEKAWEEIDRGDYASAKQITGEFLKVDESQKDALAVDRLAGAAETARNLILKGKYNEVLSKIPRHLPARGQKLGDKIRGEVRVAWLKNGESLYNAKNFDAAQATLVQFNEFFKNDVEGTKLLKATFQELFADLFKAERFEDALALLAKTQFEFTDLLENVKTTWRDFEIARFKSGDELAKERALQGLSKLAKQFGADFELRDVYGKYKGEYVQAILPQIEANLAAKNYRQSLELIDKAAPFAQDNQQGKIKYLLLRTLLDDPASGPGILKAVESSLREVMKQPDKAPNPEELLKSILRVGKNDPSFIAAVRPELIAFREVVSDDRMPPEFWLATGLSATDPSTAASGNRKTLLDAGNLFKRQDYDQSLRTLLQIEVNKEADKSLKRDYYTLFAKLGEKGMLSRNQVRLLEQSLTQHPEIKPYLVKVMTQTIARSWKTWPIAPDSWASRVKDADDAEPDQPIVLAFKAEGLLETGKSVDFKLPPGQGDEKAYVDYVRAIVAASRKKKEDTMIAARTLEKIPATESWLVPARRENASKILQTAALELTRTPDGTRRLFESAQEANLAYAWLDKALQLAGKSPKEAGSLPADAEITLALAAGCKTPPAFDINKSLGENLFKDRAKDLSDVDRVNLTLSNPTAFGDQLSKLKTTLIGVNEIKAMLNVGESQLEALRDNPELIQRQAYLYALEGWTLEQASQRDYGGIFGAYSKASSLDPENGGYSVNKGRFGALDAITAASQEIDSDKKIRLLKQGVNACDPPLKKNLADDPNWADLCLQRSQLELDLGNEYYRKDQRDGLTQAFTNAKKYAEMARDAKIPHPRQADVWLALGNSLEDLAHFAGIERSKNFAAAVEALDTAGKLNLNYYFNAGRCRYRWATNSNIVLDKDLKKDIAKTAILNLDPIAANTKNPNAAEAAYWEGHVHWALLGDEVKAFDSFKQSLALGKTSDTAAYWAKYSLEDICILANRQLKTNLKTAEAWVNVAKEGYAPLKNSPLFVDAEQAVTDVEAALNWDLAKKNLLDKDYRKFQSQFNTAFDLKHSKDAYKIAVERALLFKINRSKLDVTPQSLAEVREQAIAAIDASSLSDDQKRKERNDMDDLWKKIP